MNLDPMLSIAGLRIEGRFGGSWRTIVEVDKLEINSGEVVAFIGESGAGKTTLGLTALGYSRPGTRIAAGSVRLDGVDLLAMTLAERQALRGHRVAYVAQSAASALNPSMTVGRQISESLSLHGLSSGQPTLQRVIDVLGLMSLPDPSTVSQRYPLQISGGQQQRVMTAMAMVCAPKLLVLDEPTTALDVTTQIEVLKAIKEAIRFQNTSAIYVTHDLAVVSQIADRIIVLKNGRVVEEGTAEQIISHPKDDYTKALINAVHTIPCQVQDRLPTVPRPGILGVERVIASYRSSLFRRPQQPDWVLREAGLTVAAGETLALVGESGSGKSTLARVIAGLHPPLEGAITLNGTPLAKACRKRSKEQLRRIQIVFQSPEHALNPRVRIGDAISHVIKFYFGKTAIERNAEVKNLLEAVGLSADFAGKFPRELSGGQRQRVAIARALATHPEVILFDESLAALDTIVAKRILELMARLQEEYGIAYIFISHDLATVATIADRVAVMYAGRIVEEGRKADVFNAPAHPYTQLLLRSVPELRIGWLEDALANRKSVTDGKRMVMDDLCPFRQRCPKAVAGLCDTVVPPLRDLELGHVAVCHLIPSSMPLPTQIRAAGAL